MADTVSRAADDMWGILNHRGELWTSNTFQTEGEAEAYLEGARRNWPRKASDTDDRSLDDHRVVPVSVTITVTQ